MENVYIYNRILNFRHILHITFIHFFKSFSFKIILFLNKEKVAFKYIIIVYLI